ncbi:MAG TPA: hypothetical protein PKH07_03865 [bacterium]|nr:hypothetical protein [bacterium]
MKLLRTRRERVLFGLTMVVILGTVGYFVLYQRLSDLWVSLGDERDMLEMKIDQMRVLIEKNRQLESRCLTMKSYLEIPGSAEEQQSEVLKEITSILDQSGIVATTKPLAWTDDKNFRVFVFQFSNINCPLDSLLVLLKSIDEESSVLEVEEISISSVFMQGGIAKVKADMKLSRLVYSENREGADRTGQSASATSPKGA